MILQRQTTHLSPTQSPEKQSFRDVILIDADKKIHPIGKTSDHIWTLLSQARHTTEGKRFRQVLKLLCTATLQGEIDNQSPERFKFHEFHCVVSGFLVQDPSSKHSKQGHSVMLVIESLRREFRRPDPPVKTKPGYHFTPREHAVLQHIKQGMTNKEIATILELGVYTIKGHIKRIMQKTDIHTRSGIVGKLLAA